MQLIGYGEFHSIDGELHQLFVRFMHPDGSSFDMPVDEVQFQILISSVQQAGSLPTPAAPHRPAEAPRHNGAHIKLEEDDDDSPMRIADVDGEEQLEDGDL